jgi:hypothetical protein
VDTTRPGPVPLVRLNGRALDEAQVVVVGYAARCWWYPFGHCRRCHGSGRHMARNDKHFRLCRRCYATGRRLRIGRRA